MFSLKNKKIPLNLAESKKSLTSLYIQKPPTGTSKPLPLCVMVHAPGVGSVNYSTTTVCIIVSLACQRASCQNLTARRLGSLNVWKQS